MMLVACPRFNPHEQSFIFATALGSAMPAALKKSTAVGPWQWARLGAAIAAIQERRSPVVQGAAYGAVLSRAMAAWTTSAFGRREPLAGGRTWWAHLKCTPINIELTALRKKIEDILETVRSSPYLLVKVRSGPPRTVSRSRRKPQEISA
jgi:hypothetical protein